MLKKNRHTAVVGIKILYYKYDINTVITDIYQVTITIAQMQIYSFQTTNKLIPTNIIA